MTTDLAVGWAAQTSRGSDNEAYQAWRLDVVRIFARYLQALDPATEIPPGDVLSRRQWWIPPYLYSPAEVTALISAAGTLTIRDSKFGKSRLVFLYPTTVTALRACEKARDKALPEPEAGTFSSTDTAGRWTGTTPPRRSPCW